MNKINKFLYFFLPMMILVGCADLDLQPTNMIGEDAVKNDPKLVEAFLTKIYHNTRWEPNDHVGQRDGAKINWKHWRFVDFITGGEGTAMAPWQESIKASTEVPNASGSRTSLNYWAYGNIRSANEIIQILAEATFDPETVKVQTAEAKFLRAFMYLEMAKRYGGVPLELVPKQLDATYDELYTPRSTLQETYEQIFADCDAAIADLPGSAMSGKATKWAAHALKSRAALYAARIAKYHPQSADGLTSIPAGLAGGYYTMSHASASAIIDSGKHPLHTGGGTYQKTYSEVLTKKGNSEMIFVTEYDLGLDGGDEHDRGLHQQDVEGVGQDMSEDDGHLRDADGASRLNELEVFQLDDLAPDESAGRGPERGDHRDMHRVGIAGERERDCGDEQVEGDRIEHALHKAQVHWQKLLSLIHDKGSLDIQLQPSRSLPMPEVKRRALREEE